MPASYIHPGTGSFFWYDNDFLDFFCGKVAHPSFFWYDNNLGHKLGTFSREAAHITHHYCKPMDRSFLYQNNFEERSMLLHWHPGRVSTTTVSSTSLFLQNSGQKNVEWIRRIPPHGVASSSASGINELRSASFCKQVGYYTLILVTYPITNRWCFLPVSMCTSTLC